MSKHVQGFDAKTGVYSYKKDGSWFFSTCPPEQVQSKRVDGKWYFIETCGVGGGGGDSDVSKLYVDSQDRKLQTNIDKCFADSKDYADSIVADYAPVSYVDEQIAAIPPAPGVDLSKYSTTVEMTAADASALADAKSYADEQIDGINVSVDLSDYSTTIEMTEADNTTLADAKAYADSEIAAIPPTDLSAHATKQEVTDGDAKSLADSKKYTDDELENKVGVASSNEVDTTFRIKSSSKTLISSAGSELGLYNLRTPTDDSHAVNLGYANQHFQSFQKPIGFKFDQSGLCTSNTIPNSGEFCGLNNTAPGSSTNANPYFGNWNAGIRVHIDKLLNPQGNQFEVSERYSIAGTVSIFGKDTNKLFFRHGITAVTRDSSHPYVELIFATRIPTFGTGEITAESKYIVIVDGLTALETKTTLVPEGGESNE